MKPCEDCYAQWCIVRHICHDEGHVQRGDVLGMEAMGSGATPWLRRFGSRWGSAPCFKMELVLPMDSLDVYSGAAFMKIPHPNPRRRRRGNVQRINVVRFLELVDGNPPPSVQALSSVSFGF